MRIACVLDTDFEDSEFQKPYDAYKADGHEVTIIGLNAGSRRTTSALTRRWCNS